MRVSVFPDKFIKSWGERGRTEDVDVAYVTPTALAEALSTDYPTDAHAVGYVLLGEIDIAGLYTGFIRFKFPLDAETKEKLVSGRPSILQWPEGFFDEQFNPVGAQEIV